MDCVPVNIPVQRHLKICHLFSLRPRRHLRCVCDPRRHAYLSHMRGSRTLYRGWGEGGILTTSVLVTNAFHRRSYGPPSPRVQLLLEGIRRSVSVFIRKPIATCDFPGGVQTLCTLTLWIRAWPVLVTDHGGLKIEPAHAALVLVAYYGSSGSNEPAQPRSISSLSFLRARMH